MEHRGGCGGDSDSGDGAGILCSIPWKYLDEKMNLKDKKDLKFGLSEGVDWIALSFVRNPSDINEIKD